MLVSLKRRKIPAYYPALCWQRVRDCRDRRLRALSAVNQMARTANPRGSTPLNQYWEARRDSLYLQYVDFLVRVVARDAKSIVDVGSNGCSYLEWFNWIPRKVSIDINRPYRSRRVRGKKMDFLDYGDGRRFDLCLSLQVLEHISDVKVFAEKLLQSAGHLIICVPYRWPAGANPSHVHDPVDRKKLTTWFGRKPNYEIIVTEPITNKRRLICYYDCDDPSRELGLSDLKTRIMRS